MQCQAKPPIKLATRGQYVIPHRTNAHKPTVSVSIHHGFGLYPRRLHVLIYAHLFFLAYNNSLNNDGSESTPQRIIAGQHHSASAAYYYSFRYEQVTATGRRSSTKQLEIDIHHLEIDQDICSE
jgi:hypothetical protein